MDYFANYCKCTYYLNIYNRNANYSEYRSIGPIGTYEYKSGNRIITRLLSGVFFVELVFINGIERVRTTIDTFTKSIEYRNNRSEKIYECIYYNSRTGGNTNGYNRIVSRVYEDSQVSKIIEQRIYSKFINITTSTYTYEGDCISTKNEKVIR